MIGVVGDDYGRVILQPGMLRYTVSTIEFTLCVVMQGNNHGQNHQISTRNILVAERN